MKYYYRISVLLILGMLCGHVSLAQDDLEKLLYESVEDGRKLVSAYISPVMKSLSLGLNQGWYNTAAPHKIAGIDITVTANAMTIPQSELFYNVEELNLQVLKLHESSPDGPFAPTVVGPDRAPIFTLQDDESEVQDGPGGLDLEGELGKNWVPVPMAHVGIGLPKGTDLKVRWTPTLDFDDTSVKLIGFGVMHNVKQWIPGVKLLPFDLS